MPTFDAVIYGANMSGCMAAKELAARGRSVAVIDPLNWRGGLNTGGICLMDYGDKRTEWGYWKQLCQTVANVYGGSGADLSYSFRFEPKEMTAALDAMLAGESNITWVYDAPLETVTKTGSLITSITCGGVVYTSTQFIEASYEGDLMAMAGCACTHGRESVNNYGEALGGISFADGITRSYGVVDAKGNRYDVAQPGYDGREGDGDARIQGYNFRMVWSQKSDRLPWQAPPGYRREDFLDVLHEVTSRGLTNIFTPDDFWFRQPINGTGAGPSAADKVRTVADGKSGINQRDQYWLASEWATASWPRRKELMARLYYRFAGTLYFLANDSSVPSAMRTYVNTWGLCADEYQGAGNYYGQPGWSPVVYVREGRRLIGQYVMTQADFNTDCVDPVCVANYFVDRHTVSHFAKPDGTSIKEGHRAASNYRSTGVPFRAMKPWAGQADNLIVANTISTTSVIWQPIRMEPTFAQLGQVAGMAAHLALSGSKPVGQVAYADLLPLLTTANAILTRSQAL